MASVSPPDVDLRLASYLRRCGQESWELDDAGGARVVFKSTAYRNERAAGVLENG